MNHTLDTNQQWKMHQDVTDASNGTASQEEKAKQETYEKAVGDSGHGETINHADDDAIEDGNDNDASEESDSLHDAMEQDKNNTIMSVVTTTKRNKKEINKTAKQQKKAREGKRRKLGMKIRREQNETI
mmetsp:Transcript_26711/g.39073  ORF Transcript_26711/g.39073 Transcript_26711/m.39073 type:complete len:129 (+) Transcript_26711:235-621(+)